MTCCRCGKEFSKKGATDDMLNHNLCILCIMEYHRKGEESLVKFSNTKRESHFKI